MRNVSQCNNSIGTLHPALLPDSEIKMIEIEPLLGSPSNETLESSRNLKMLRDGQGSKAASDDLHAG